MRRAYCKILIYVVGIAVGASLASCGGNGAPDASSPAAPSPSSQTVDVDASFAQFAKAVKPFWCSDAYDDMANAHDADTLDVMNARVHEYRGVMTTWDDELGRIAVPLAAQPIVDKLRALNAAEIADLDALAEVVNKSRVDEKDKDKDVKETNRLLRLVYFDDALVGVEIDNLSAALGKPEDQAQIAVEQLEVADQTFYKDIYPVGDMFEAALSHDDLNGAKAANAIEEEAAQHYIDRLGAIGWPAGVEDQVNALRDSLRKLIDFDRRQVDVATAAEIVPPEEDGTPIGQAVEAAREPLDKGVMKLAQVGPMPQCGPTA
jgi:hypothetical protein